MRIEIWQRKGYGKAQTWHWHFKNQGRIIAAAEAFPSKDHALRAAKACVRQIMKLIVRVPVVFVAKLSPDGKVLVLRWL